MLKVFEAFAGIGSQTQALKNIGVEHEVVAIAEIDKYAIASYEAIHGEANNVGDITKLNTENLPDFDLFTYSFPCQDISLAGKQQGLDKGSETRSSLLWECERIIREKKPKYLLLENVKNLVGKKHKANFDEWLSILEELGYKNHWQVLNAKDYGVAQNRERVFVVSIRNDAQKGFRFPEKQELTKKLKDYLDEDVEEKYFLKKEYVDTFVYKDTKNYVGELNCTAYKYDTCKRIYDEKCISPTLTAHASDATPKIIVEGVIEKIPFKARQRVLSGEGISETICAACGTGGNTQPKVLIKNATKKGYLEASDGDGVSLAYPNSTTRRGRVQKECSPTLTTNDQVGVIDELRIRKLTPRECWRLMGFEDEQFEKAEKVCSNTQLYKQAGNSIVVNVLEAIFTNLFKEE